MGQLRERLHKVETGWNHKTIESFGERVVSNLAATSRDTGIHSVARLLRRRVKTFSQTLLFRLLHSQSLQSGDFAIKGFGQGRGHMKAARS